MAANYHVCLLMDGDSQRDRKQVNNDDVHERATWV